MTERIPVHVLTGFLGSGKTTLLQKLLRSPELADSAVLVNELGEIGLDHHLLEHIDEETVLLASGCLCCTIRGELSAAIRDLFDRRERGETPPFRRLLIETTGLAEPGPIVTTLNADPVIRHHFALGRIVTVVDAVNGLGNLAHHPESAKQAAVADRLAISKSDIADPAAVERLREALRRINPTAAQTVTTRKSPLPRDVIRDLTRPADGTADPRRLLAMLQATELAADHDHDHSRHGAGIHAFCLVLDEPIAWEPFSVWLTMLLHRHGERVLRVKGLLAVAGCPTPVVLQGVQHVIHPPAHLEAWPTDDRRTRLVFIVDGLRRERIEASLATFAALAATGLPRARAAQA